MAEASRLLVGGIGAIGALLVACTPPQGGWDLRALEARQPSLAGQAKQRLGDATPYFVPDASAGELVLFLCRWELDRSLRVSLPAGASRGESDTISLALAAWEGAGLGLRFELRASGEPADITLHFPPEPEQPGELPRAAGGTIADCALARGLVGPSQRAPVDARLAFASVELSRVLYDPAGRPSPVTPEQMLGATIHELGHALGFSGHVRSRDSVMSAAPGEVRRIGARVLRGEALEAPTLAALYGLPNGVIVGRLAVAQADLDPLLRFEQLARADGLRGPFVRVGDRSGRLLWREPGGRAAGSFVVREWRAVLDDPSRFSLIPTARAVSLLRSGEGAE